MAEQFYHDTALVEKIVVEEREDFSLDLESIMKNFYSSGLDFLSFYKQQYFSTNKVFKNKKKEVLKSKKNEKNSKKVTQNQEIQLGLFNLSDENFSEIQSNLKAKNPPKIRKRPSRSIKEKQLSLFSF